MLLHYRNWVESRYWLPQSLCLEETPKKTPKGQLTWGQHAEKVCTTVSSRFHKTPQLMTYQKMQGTILMMSTKIWNLLKRKLLLSLRTFAAFYGWHKPLLLTASRFVSFTDEQMKMQWKYKRSVMISLKFASKYHKIFSEAVMGHWASSRQNEKARWGPISSATRMLNCKSQMHFCHELI